MVSLELSKLPSDCSFRMDDELLPGTSRSLAGTSVRWTSDVESGLIQGAEKVHCFEVGNVRIRKGCRDAERVATCVWLCARERARLMTLTAYLPT